MIRKAAVLTISCALVASLAAAQMKVTQSAPSGTTTKQATPQPKGQPQSEEQMLAGARRIDRAEAMKLVAAGKAVYVDVRSKTTFDRGHLPGAVNIPLSVLRANVSDAVRMAPAGKMLITYCACHEEHTAAIAVLDLARYGVKNAAALKGGWNEWKAAGLPTQQ